MIYGKHRSCAPTRPPLRALRAITLLLVLHGPQGACSHVQIAGGYNRANGKLSTQQPGCARSSTNPSKIKPSRECSSPSQPVVLRPDDTKPGTKLRGPATTLVAVPTTLDLTRIPTPTHDAETGNPHNRTSQHLKSLVRTVLTSTYRCHWEQYRGEMCSSGRSLPNGGRKHCTPPPGFKPRGNTPSISVGERAPRKPPGPSS